MTTRERQPVKCSPIFSDAIMTWGHRSITYSSGGPPSFPSRIHVGADDELLLKSEMAAAILRHGIQHLPATEAGATYAVQHGLHFCLRWVETARSGTPIPNTRFEEEVGKPVHSRTAGSIHGRSVSQGN